MKVQCDVCAAEAASVFCCADEAALCDACDRRVHRANKLAGKHRRLSLLSPAAPSSSAQQTPPPPLCDICQVRSLFIPYHTDACVCVCSASDRSAALRTCMYVSQEKRGLLFCKEDRAILCRDCDVPVHTASELAMRHTRFLLTGVRLSAEPAARPPPSEEDENDSSGSSSISEYLTKTLPGWHVEDFLVDETAAAATTIGVSTDVSYQVGGVGPMHSYCY
jgi:hypothetical protein